MAYRRGLLASLVILLFGLAAAAPLAQSNGRRFEAAGHIGVAASNEFDESDVGVGGRITWMPLAMVGVDAEILHYPSDYPDGVAFSRARWEGFFGATVGPRLGRWRPFATLRPGFVTYREAPEPIACIAIFPPPLACTLASGRSVLAFDLGGGMDVDVAQWSVIRLEISDRLLRYAGPVFDGNRTRRDGNFWGHGLRVSVGAGIRF